MLHKERGLPASLFKLATRAPIGLHQECYEIGTDYKTKRNNNVHLYDEFLNAPKSLLPLILRNFSPNPSAIKMDITIIRNVGHYI